MLLHAADAVSKGFKKISLNTVDTDVVVLAVTSVPKLELRELWVAFGTGKCFRYIPAHAIATFLGPEKSRALPMFHAFTGCDTVSSFVHRGKKTAWNIWKAYDEATTAFMALSGEPEDVPHAMFAILKHFTILTFNRTSCLDNINEARRAFCQERKRHGRSSSHNRCSTTAHQKNCLSGWTYLGPITEGIYQLTITSRLGLD